MEKQIEEMAKTMCKLSPSNGSCVTDTRGCHLECVYGVCAQRLYNAGYRKIPEHNRSMETHNANVAVHCKICKHGKLIQTQGLYLCLKTGGCLRNAEDFCNYGEEENGFSKKTDS